MTHDEIVERLRAFCASASTLGVATVDEDGRPHAANVNFVADDEMNLYFISDPECDHARHIARQPLVAGTAYLPFDRVVQIRGIQLRGRCDVVPDVDFDRVWSMFVRRFPYASEFESRARAERFYRITPSWFRMIDNSVRFGHKWETGWPP